MSPKPPVDFAEVTRLTRLGRLREAMALLRGEPAADQTDSAAEDRPPRTDSRGAAPSTPAVEPFEEPDRSRGDSVPLLGMLQRIRRGVGAQRRHPGSPFAPVPPPPVPPGAHFERRLYRGAAGTLPYRLYRPSGTHGEPLPLVLMLHGCSQSADDFAAGTGMNSLAEEQLAFIAYPEQSESANATHCWNWFRPEHQERDHGEPALLAGITRELIEELNVDPERVYVAGLSAGAATALILGLAYPDLYAAIGIHSGMPHGVAQDLPSAMRAMREGVDATTAHGITPDRLPAADPIPRDRPRPCIVFHGDHDALVNPLNAEHIIAQVTGGVGLRETLEHGVSAAGIRYRRRRFRDPQGRVWLEHWLLHGLGHAWSGGSPTGSYTDARGPDASREMLRFFLQHRRTTDAAGSSDRSRMPAD
ncbi:hypothetical protein CKO25_12495 [Thiocapsa imhoffii]|uniref:PHB depolymerase family esterase n=1 Tax=Thiocapsa imhoffii TaxID=382777 RepID=A0A9X0WIP0_9GAMM|nr:PHB depolymerase family esterase [Thiocapsa imhoffii]MBK1645449.1 hypothetical protein [Thiocapsa imhoffii]